MLRYHSHTRTLIASRRRLFSSITIYYYFFILQLVFFPSLKLSAWLWSLFGGMQQDKLHVPTERGEEEQIREKKGTQENKSTFHTFPYSRNRKARELTHTICTPVVEP